jgi:hypothetical protein
MLNQFALILLKNIAKHFFDKQFISYYIIFYKENKIEESKRKIINIAHLFFALH